MKRRICSTFSSDISLLKYHRSVMFFGRAEEVPRLLDSHQTNSESCGPQGAFELVMEASLSGGSATPASASSWSSYIFRSGGERAVSVLQNADAWA
jgi:hypothetical protein